MAESGFGGHIVERLKRLLPARMRGGAVVPVVRLSGVIGAVTPLRPGMSLAGVARLLERAFATKGARAVALVINSPGGSVTAGLSISDTMQFIKPDVSTLCIGQAASMGAFLLTAGAKGKRFALPNSRLMIHQPLGGFQGQASDIAIHAKEILSIRDRLNRIMADHTGQPIERIEKDTDRDNFLSAAEAAEYGLIDKVLSRRETA